MATLADIYQIRRPELCEWHLGTVIATPARHAAMETSFFASSMATPFGETSGSKASALLADLDALRDFSGAPFEARENVPGRVSSTALVCNRLVDYSAPAVHAHKKVTIKGYVDRVEIPLGAEIVAAIGAAMSAATWSTTRCTISHCLRRSRACWTRRRRCGAGSSIRPSMRCAACSRRASGRAASGTTSRPCACWRTSRSAR